MSSAENPTLPDVIREALLSSIATIETAMPARITAYDHDAQKASVQPLIKGVRLDPDTNERIFYELPEIPNIPVAFPQGSSGPAGFSITWPLAIGDRVLVVFCSRDIAGWLESDGDTNEPQDSRRHDLNDAVIIPGLASFASPLGTEAINNSATVIRGPEIRLGSSAATDFVALASRVLTELGDIWFKFNAHTHVGVTTGPGVSGVPSDITGSASSVAASKVKAE